MLINEIKSLAIADKIEIMETLWEEFRDRYDNAEISEEMKALLDYRRQQVRTGKAQLVEWDEVKNSIGKR